MNFTILGSGIAGISAAYHLEQKGHKCIIYEKDSNWGGLCSNFTLDGFRFDRFVHFSFPKDEYITDIFRKSVDLYEHPSISSNYYNGKWLKHPAQNNLAPLSSQEKTKIILDFINRPVNQNNNFKNYEQWLRCQYGNFFAENFPFSYTRKYWGVEPNQLETKWVGNRMHSPDLEEVLLGAFEEQSKIFYYTNIMKYPKTGGFRSILNGVRKDLIIEFNKQVLKIDLKNKIIFFADGSKQYYDVLVSTIPLPEMVNIIIDTPNNIKEAGVNLMHTSGYQISLGFNRPDVAKHLWFYIYNEDIPPARIYSPSLKSPDNAPNGCSSLQAEVFFNNKTSITNANEILNKTINKLIGMGLFNKTDIIVKDIRFEKYANIIFEHNIYKNRKIVKDYLSKNNIYSIGRFGQWDYLWSHQAFKDGIDLAEII